MLKIIKIFLHNIIRGIQNNDVKRYMILDGFIWVHFHTLLPENLGEKHTKKQNRRIEI